MNPIVGGYRVQDIDFVAAFDVDERKVGKKLHEAISMGANITRKITDALEYNTIVHRGPTLDGVIEQMRESFIRESAAPIANIADVLRESKADVVLNLLPTGSEEALHFYAEAALSAGCNFVNCIPTPLAVIPEWKNRFESKGLVLLGDDIKSQIGATILNRFLLELLKMRGVHILKSEQENKGGNADHFNLLYRSTSKEKSKREALKQFLDEGDAEPEVKFLYTGMPSGHKVVTIKIEGEIFGRAPIVIRSVIEDEISINGAGVAIDAVRAAKFLADGGRQKEVEMVCPFLFKSPPGAMSDEEAYKSFVSAIK
jgi:myo-inositol-1-phosphate synthase